MGDLSFDRRYETHEGVQEGGVGDALDRNNDVLLSIKCILSTWCSTLILT